LLFVFLTLAAGAAASQAPAFAAEAGAHVKGSPSSKLCALRDEDPQEAGLRRRSAGGERYEKTNNKAFSWVPS